VYKNIFLRQEDEYQEKKNQKKIFNSEKSHFRLSYNRNNFFPQKLGFVLSFTL
jgi:hypothetical protein